MVCLTHLTNGMNIGIPWASNHLRSWGPSQEFVRHWRCRHCMPSFSMRPIWRAHYDIYIYIYRSFRLVTGGSKPHLHSSTATLLLVLFPSLTVVLSMVLVVSMEDPKFLGLSSMSSRANAIASVSSTNLLVMSSPSPLTIMIWVSIYIYVVFLALIKNTQLLLRPMALIPNLRLSNLLKCLLDNATTLLYVPCKKS